MGFFVLRMIFVQMKRKLFIGRKLILMPFCVISFYAHSSSPKVMTTFIFAHTTIKLPKLLEGYEAVTQKLICLTFDVWQGYW